ncbi:MAG TPA: hypothetical protein VFA12_01250 [Stellaceae bacterium]|nr:hypothetical protein [Stellaceae bacterium]
MRSQTSGEGRPTKRFMRRLDRVAAELNVVLVVIAIGLGVLDLTCLWALAIERSLPITYAQDNDTAGVKAQ